MESKQGWHWSKWFGIMYGKIPVGVIAVAIVYIAIQVASS